MLWIRLIDMKLLTFLCRYNNWIGFWRKLRKGGAVVRALASLPPGGGNPYNSLYSEAPTERGTFFLLQVYERVGLLLVLILAERFFSGCSGFPLSPKTVQPFDPQCTDSFKRVLNNFWELRGKTNYKLQFYLFIFFEWYFGHVKIDVAVWPEWILNLSDIIGNIFC